MELIIFKWSWCPDGYELRDKLIIPKSDHVILEDPTRYNLSVFRNFVDAAGSADAAIQFSNQFGLLLNGATMSLAEWKKHHKAMVHAWRSGQAGDWVGLQISINEPEHGVLKAGISSDPDDFADMRLVLEPANLLQFMWVEMALTTMNHVGLRACDWCGAWFPYGRGTNRRETARFCSDKCRKANHLKVREA